RAGAIPQRPQVGRLHAPPAGHLVHHELTVAISEEAQGARIVPRRPRLRQRRLQRAEQRPILGLVARHPLTELQAVHYRALAAGAKMATPAAPHTPSPRAQSQRRRRIPARWPAPYPRNVAVLATLPSIAACCKRPAADD